MRNETTTKGPGATQAGCPAEAAGTSGAGTTATTSTLPATTGAADGGPSVHFWPVSDLTGVDFDPDLAALMREGPLTRIRLPNGEGWAWLATRYDDVRMVTNDPRFSRKAVVGNDVTRLAPHFIPVDGAVGFEDPPDHTRLRRSVAAAFTTRAMDRLRGRAQDMLDGLVDGVLRDGPPADLVERVLAPFPLAVVCELMGVPERTGRGCTSGPRSSCPPPTARSAASRPGPRCATTSPNC